MKKIIIIVAVILYSNQAISKPQTDPQNKWELTAFTSRLEGKANEIVYDGNKKVSELNWDISHLYMLGAAIGYKIHPQFKIKASYANNINHGKNNMVDTDWLVDSTDEWSDRSWDKPNIQKAYNLDIGFSYLIHDNFSLVAGYKRNYFKWNSGSSGSYLYSSDSNENDIIDPDEFRNISGTSSGSNGIIYSQTFDIPYIGLEYKEKLLNKLQFSIYGAYSPLVYARDRDFHVARGILFKEEFKNGNYYNIGTNIEYKITEYLSTGIGMDYNEVSLIRGDTFITKDNKTVIIRDSAGISNYFTKYSFMINYAF